MNLVKLATAALSLVLLGQGPARAGPVSDASTCTGAPSNVRIYVNVEGIKTSKGLIAVTLYPDDPKKFLAKRGSLYVGRVAAQAPRTRVCIYLPSTGVWALAVYHDANSSRSFNRTGLGLPAEGFAFSNNAKTLLGLPNFSSVRLHVPRNGMQTNVKLKYY